MAQSVSPPLTVTARAAGLRTERALASPRFWNGRFHNTKRVGPGLKGNPLPILGEYFFGGDRRVPARPLPVTSPLPAWAAPPATPLRTTWLGHSSVLLELGGFRVLTDPVFGERASPLRFAGPRRFHPVPVSVAELPPLDAVLVSHDHYDHLCKPTITKLAALGVPFITSLGVGAHLEEFGVPHGRIVELDSCEEHVLPGGRLSFTATPAQHFSGRGMADRNRASWSSFCIRSDSARVFFSGDTGYTEEFSEIGRRLGPFDLTLLEVGAFHPAWGDIHLGPENALRVHALLGGGTLLPVHWGTFNLGLHPWDEPAETLLRLATERGVRLLTPGLGEVLEPARAEAPRAWWRGSGASQRLTGG